MDNEHIQKVADEVYEFGPFRLDAVLYALTRQGKPVRLPPKAIDVLLALVRAGGNFVSREDLLKQVWADAHVSAPSVDYQIFLIRRTLGIDADFKPFVETVPRRGFRLTSTITRVSQQVTVRHERGTWRRRAGYAAALVLVAGVTVGLSDFVHRPTPSLRVVEFIPLTRDRESKPFPLFADRERVYFESDLRPGVRFVPVGGGEPHFLFPNAQDYHLLDVSGTRHEFLARRAEAGKSDTELWVLPAGLGMPRRVGGIVCSFATWTHDGGKIAFIAGGHPYVANGDGTDVKKLPLPEPGSPSWIRWSPDGALLRFTLRTTDTAMQPATRLWEVRPDGTALRPVTSSSRESPRECCGTWTPDGAYYVFEATRDGRTDLWALPKSQRVFGAREVAPIQLTAGPLSFSGPAVSFDGASVFAVGVRHEGQLMRLDSDGQLDPYLPGVIGTWLTFSPDRKWIAYVGYPEQTLWRARADGSGRQALVSGAFELDGSSWSPDGKWIAFRSRMSGRHSKISLIPADGGEPLTISPEDREQGIPSWSPDSTRLTFGDVPGVFGRAKGDEVIHIYDVSRRQFSTVPNSEGLWTSRWSPGGRYIAALTIATQTLMLFDSRTGKWRTLSADHVDNPTWSHDSQFVYYDTEGGIRALRRVRVSDGRVEELANLEHVQLAAFWWSGLTPDDSPIVLGSFGATEVYALRLGRR